MKREQLEHILRAAADVSGDPEIVVIGGQAILGEHPSAPEGLLASIEADVYPRNHPDRSVQVEGALGDGSPFHSTFGYYAHGVGPETAKAPEGWETRLIRVDVPGTSVTGWCLETHDLVLAKLVAGRDRDRAFAAEALRAGLVDPEELQRRAATLPVVADQRRWVLDTLRALAS